MTIAQTNAIQTTAAGQETTNSAAQALDQNAFMSLLVAQLKNQNPLEPMQNEQFVLQLSQLTTLDKLQGLTDSVGVLTGTAKWSSAATMVGRQVLYKDPVEGGILAGRVDGVSVEEDGVHLLIADTRIPLGAITEVGQEVLPEDGEPEDVEQ